MSRFFVSPENIGDKYISITEQEDIHHISKVLRLKPSDEIDISDSLEWEYRTEIIGIEKDLVELKIMDKQKFSREPNVHITLFQGLPKQGKMELIIQKAVELGAFEVAPVFTDRSIVTDNGKMGKKIERWQKIADTAAAQCHHSHCLPLQHSGMRGAHLPLTEWCQCPFHHHSPSLVSLPLAVSLRCSPGSVPVLARYSAVWLHSMVLYSLLTCQCFRTCLGQLCSPPVHCQLH